MTSLCLFLSLLIADAAGAGSFDAYSSAQAGMSQGSYTLKNRASGSFSENVISTTAGFSFEGLGVVALVAGSYTDASKPSGFGPDASGVLYPPPAGRSLRYGLQARYQISMFEIFAAYLPGVHFSGQFKADGASYTYSYSGGGYEASPGLQVGGPEGVAVNAVVRHALETPVQNTGLRKIIYHLQLLFMN